MKQLAGVQDGHFVDNLTIGAPVVASLRKHTDAFLDCHLMVSEPAKWVQVCAPSEAPQPMLEPRSVAYQLQDALYDARRQQTV